MEVNHMAVLVRALHEAFPELSLQEVFDLIQPIMESAKAKVEEKKYDNIWDLD
jgi:hypothetical protein